MSQTIGSVKGAITTVLTQAPPSWLITETLNQLPAIFLKTEAIVNEVGIELDKVHSNKTWSETGKQDKSKELAERSVEKFSSLGRAIADQTERVQQLNKSMLGPITSRPEGDAVVQYHREAEARRFLSHLDANAREAQWLAALERDDFETARALLDAPMGSWVSPEMRRRGEDMFAKRTKPEMFERRRSLEYLREHLNMLAEMIRQWLIGLGADKDLVVKTLPY